MQRPDLKSFKCSLFPFPKAFLLPHFFIQLFYPPSLCQQVLYATCQLGATLRVSLPGFFLRIIFREVGSAHLQIFFSVGRKSDTFV